MEIKVLSKAFDILELAARRRSEPLLPGELADELALPRSTCVRLLKILTASGYLEQVSRRKGYQLGPVSYFLGGGMHYRSKLTDYARKMLEPLSLELGISIQTSCRHGNFRVILCGFNGDPTLKLNYGRPRYGDLHLSVTGRMLLSHASESEQTEIVSAWPTPEHGAFTGMKPEAILAELEKIARLSELVEPHAGKIAAALPIRQNNEIAAVLGAVWHDEFDAANREHYMIQLRRAAEKLSSAISPENIG